MQIEKTITRNQNGTYDAVVIVDGEIAAEYRNLS
jgi:hypothetical protein